MFDVLKLRIIVMLFLFFLTNCAVQQQHEERIEPEPEGEFFQISEVSVEPRIFDPDHGELVTISFHISHPAKAIIKIFDPQMRLVRDLLPERIENPGKIQITWDGRDLEGNVIADEAYFFTIEALNQRQEMVVYDPTTISGGEYFDLAVAFDREKHTVNYTLPKDARVVVRAGISRGPLLTTHVNHAPRLAGLNEEPWDGRDESGTIDTTCEDDFKLTAEAISLPENSIISVGNQTYTFFVYATEVAPDRPLKVERPLFRNENTQAALLSGRDYQTGVDPEFRLILPPNTPRNNNDLPVVSGKVPVKVYLDKTVKRYVTEQRYEIICFVDFKFVTEQEEGYSPSTWVWNTNNVVDGEHTLTVNAVTLAGRKKSASLKVFVRNLELRTNTDDS